MTDEDTEAGVEMDAGNRKRDNMTLASDRNRHWMEAGTVVEGAMTAQEALEAGQLDWDVEKRKLYLENSKGNKVLVKDRFAIVRADTEQPLGLVGSKYVPFQNRQAFSFVDALIDETDGAHYAAVFSQRSSRVVGLVVELPTSVKVGGEDSVRFDLLFRTSHDGSKAISAYISAINQRCTNQEAVILKNATHKWSVRHISSAEGRLAEAREALTMTTQYAKEFESVANQLAESELALQELRNILTDSLPDRPKTIEIVDEVSRLFEESDTIHPKFRGTAWGGLQAVTEYFDWGRNIRSRESWLYASLDGMNAQVRNRVTRQLLTR